LDVSNLRDDEKARSVAAAKADGDLKADAGLYTRRKRR